MAQNNNNNYRKIMFVNNTYLYFRTNNISYMNHKTLIITKLDTGYYLESDDEKHGISSNDKLIAKIRDIFDISTTSKKRNEVDKPIVKSTNPIQPKPPTTTKLKDALDIKKGSLKFGIITSHNENGKWPIKQSDYLVPELISIPNNEKVTYAETLDQRIVVEYKTGKIYTTWDEITNMLSEIDTGNELLHVPVGFSSNQRTCIRQFMIAVRDNGLKAGDSVNLDPDKDFRKQLHISSAIEYERGTLKEVMAD